MNARTQQTQMLDAAVENVRFAHGKRSEGLRELHINTIQDLLEHFPFRYDDFSQVVKIIDAHLGEKCAVMGTIIEAKGRRTAKGGYLFEVVLKDQSGVLKAVWFNQRWLADTLKVGTQVLLLGKLEHYGGFANMASPLYSILAEKEQAESSSAKDGLAADTVPTQAEPVGILPVYRANSLISSNWIKRIVLEARKIVPEPLDPLPPKLRIKRRLVSRQIAWRTIHTPATLDGLTDARHRLAYEQVFWEQLSFAFAEAQLCRGLDTFVHSTDDTFIKRLNELLPFELTESQKQATADILHDMRQAGRMHRLLLGDVGSGKTIVALQALIVAAQSGWQATMMAPTEVLAQQYAHTAGDYLDKLGISWTLVTSALKTSERLNVLEGIRSGSIQIVFGTHALLEPDVVFKQLSLIIIDEQHRFGVEHRNTLIAKSPTADFLSMTATPIPRSLALVLYGAIEASYLAQRPRRVATRTTTVDSSVSYKAYEAVRQALSRGEQAYIVCPLISAPKTDDDEDPQYLDDLESFHDEPSITAAEAELEHLRRQVFPEHRIELLTSRVKSDEKQRIMQAFKQGAIDVLVSTTVIEVGVDVPNATVMIVLDADRFGLAQLHQLRGRVGRGDRPGEFYLVSHKPADSARRRLRLLEKYSDGLTLSEKDLALRKEGDLAGTRQHGASMLSLVNVVRDSKLIEAAHDDVMRLIELDPQLEMAQHQHLLYELKRKNQARTD